MALLSLDPLDESRDRAEYAAGVEYLEEQRLDKLAAYAPAPDEMSEDIKASTIEGGQQRERA